VKKTKLLFLVSEDWYFCSHRLHLAVAARRAGFDVAVATRVNADEKRIRDAGIGVFPVHISRSGFNPAADIGMLFALIRLYRRVRPDIVHHVAMKPVLYGTLAAYISGVPHVVNAVAGMGFVFSSGDKKARLLRPLIRFAFRRLLGAGKSHLIVQNPDDRDFFMRRIGLPEASVSLIAGSGVDIHRFRPTPFPQHPPVVVALVARMLVDKGVREFVEAIRRLRLEGLDIRGILVGEEDAKNPAHVPHDTMCDWEKEGVIEWWGRRADIPEIWAGSHIAVLPSYREGLPKSLLEAAACGRPIVTTDVPGCREIVRHGDNGLLVRPRDVESLAAAIRTLAEDAELREKMGRFGRKLVEQRFSNEHVQEQTLALYQRLLSV